MGAWMASGEWASIRKKPSTVCSRFFPPGYTAASEGARRPTATAISRNERTITIDAVAVSPLGRLVAPAVVVGTVIFATDTNGATSTAAPDGEWGM